MNTVTPSIHKPAEQPERDILIFVYGTLKRNGKYHPHYLSDAEFVNNTSIEGFTMFTVNGQWPYARPAEGKHINGEWWCVSEREFEAIAAMEMGAGYDLCTVNGQCWFFAIMNDELWARIEEARSSSLVHIGPDWNDIGSYEYWLQQMEERERAAKRPKPRQYREADTYRCTDHCEKLEHEMRDYCYTCAPYWDAVPMCPECHLKLRKGKVMFSCPRCHKRFTWKGDAK